MITRQIFMLRGLGLGVQGQSQITQIGLNEYFPSQEIGTYEGYKAYRLDLRDVRLSLEDYLVLSAGPLSYDSDPDIEIYLDSGLSNLKYSCSTIGRDVCVLKLA
jgi:hypothetical protein